MDQHSIKRHEWWIVITLLYVTLLTIWSPASLNAALPQIQEHFADTPNSELLTRLVLTFPALFIAISAPIAGWAIDRWGRKKVLVSSVVLYAVVGPVGLYIDSLAQLLFARALLGVAIGGTMTTAITLIGDYFEGPKRSRVMGFQSAALEFGAVFFTLVGGFLAMYSWRAPFFIYFLTIPLIPLILWAIHEPSQGSAQRGHRESAAEMPTVKFPPGALAAYLMAIVTMMAIFLMPVHLPFLLARQMGIAEPFMISIAIGFSTLLAGVAATSYHRVRKSFTTVQMFIPCYLFMALGYLVFAFAHAYWMILLGAALSGAGIGLFLPNINMWVVSMSPGPLRGRVVSGLMSGIFVGQFASPVVSTPIATTYGIDQLFLMTSVLSFLTAAAIMIIALSSKSKSTEITPSKPATDEPKTVS